MHHIITILICFITALLEAQNITSTVVGQGFYLSYGGTGRDISSAVEVMNDGYVFAGSTNSQSLASKEIIITRTDLSGSILWSKIYGGSGDDEAHAIQRTSDGGFIVAGSSKSFTGTGTDNFNALLLKIDGSGVAQWAKCYGGNSDDVIYAVKQCTDNGYVMTGYTGSFGNGGKDLLFIRTDGNGIPVMSKAIGGPANEFGRGILESSAGEYVINGSTNGFSSPGPVTHFMKLNSSGTLQWSKKITYTWNTYVQTGYGLMQNTAGKFVFTGTSGDHSIGAGSAILFQCDNSGNIEWAYDYGFNSGKSFGYEVCQEGNGGYSVFGTMGNYTPISFRTNSTGSFVTVRCYSDLSWNIQGKGYAGKLTPDGGCIISGIHYTGNTDTNQILIKADSNYEPGCNVKTLSLISSGTPTTEAVTNPAAVNGGTYFTVALTGTNLSLPVNPFCNNVPPTNELKEWDTMKGKISVCPNPFHSSFTIEVLDGIYEGRMIILTNTLGQEVKRAALPDRSNLISVPDLQSGVYFYTLFESNIPTHKGKLIADQD